VDDGDGVPRFARHSFVVCVMSRLV
jgi:hypothetical protein